MFANQVSIKDLFSSNPGFPSGTRHDATSEWEHENNSSGHSSSQHVYSQSQSQLEFPDSQDLYGSQPSSQKESSTNSPSKFYQRYMAKGPFYNNRENCPKSTSQPPKTSFQQQLAANKAKAKERDERDLLNRILMSIKECSNEVKEVVSVVKGTIESETSSNSSVLAKSLENIENVLSKNKEEFSTALEIRDQTKEEIAALQEQIKERDMTIANLKKEKEALAGENQSCFLQRLEKLYDENNAKIKHSIENVYESHQSELTKQAATRDDYQQQLLEHQEMIMNKNTVSLQNMETRIGKEVHGSCRKILEEGERSRIDRTRELTLLQQQHLSQVNQIVQTQISECISSQMAVMKDMITQYWQQNRPNVTAKPDRQAIEDDVQHRYDIEVQELRRRFQQEVKEIMEPKSAPSISKEHDLPIESNWWDKSTEKNQPYQVSGIYCASDQDKRRSSYNNPSEGAFAPQRASPLVNVLDPTDICSESMMARGRPSSEPALQNMFSGSMDKVFKSPMATMAKSWTSKMLFSKCSPSTIATVRPQQAQLTPVGQDEYKVPSTSKKTTKKKRKTRRKASKEAAKDERQPQEVGTSGGYSLRKREHSQPENHEPESPQMVPKAKRLTNRMDMLPKRAHHDPTRYATEKMEVKYPRSTNSIYATSVKRSQLSDVNRDEPSVRTNTVPDVFNFDDETVSPLTRHRDNSYASWGPSKQPMTSDQRWEMAKMIEPRQREVDGYPTDFDYGFVDSTEMYDNEESSERDSQMSSPSLSVTEFCIKRRIKQNKPKCKSIICSSATSVPEISTAVYTTTSQTVIERNAFQVSAGQTSVKKGKRKRSRKR